MHALQIELRSSHRLSLTDPDMSQVALSDLRGANAAAESRASGSGTGTGTGSGADTGADVGTPHFTPLVGLFPGDLTLRWPQTEATSLKTEAAAASGIDAGNTAAGFKSEESSAPLEAPVQSGSGSGQQSSTFQADLEHTATIKVESSSPPPETEVHVCITVHVLY